MSKPSFVAILVRSDDFKGSSDSLLATGALFHRSPLFPQKTIYVAIIFQETEFHRRDFEFWALHFA